MHAWQFHYWVIVDSVESSASFPGESMLATICCLSHAFRSLKTLEKDINGVSRFHEPGRLIATHQWSYYSVQCYRIVKVGSSAARCMHRKSMDNILHNRNIHRWNTIVSYTNHCELYYRTGKPFSFFLPLGTHQTRETVREYRSPSTMWELLADMFCCCLGFVFDLFHFFKYSWFELLQCELVTFLFGFVWVELLWLLCQDCTGCGSSHGSMPPHSLKSWTGKSGSAGTDLFLWWEKQQTVIPLPRV